VSFRIVAAQHPKKGLKPTEIENTRVGSTAMTEEVDWFKVRMWELKKLLRGSDYTTIYDDSGVKVIGDLTEWLKMKGAAKFQNNLNPVVAVTENDDVVFLQDFEEAPSDRSKAIIHLDGIYEYIKQRAGQQTFDVS
jgi:hypothetical protein